MEQFANVRHGLVKVACSAWLRMVRIPSHHWHVGVNLRGLRLRRGMT